MKKQLILPLLIGSFLFVNIQAGIWDNFKHNATKHTFSTACAILITGLTLGQVLAAGHYVISGQDTYDFTKARLILSLPVYYLLAYHFTQTVLGKNCKHDRSHSTEEQG